MVQKIDPSCGLQNEVRDLVSSLGFTQLDHQNTEHTDGFDIQKKTKKLRPNKSKLNQTPARLHDGRQSNGANFTETMEVVRKQSARASENVHNIQSKNMKKERSLKTAKQKKNPDSLRSPFVEQQVPKSFRRNQQQQQQNGDYDALEFPDDNPVVRELSEHSEVAAPTDDRLWYQKSVTHSGEVSACAPSTVTRLRQEASSLMDCAVANFKKTGGGESGSRWRWMCTVLSSGTLSDKLAVRYALLQRAPHVNLHLLDDCIKLLSAKGKSHAITAMARLSAMFTEFLLPAGRLLRPFSHQPLAQLDQMSEQQRQDQLILWLFEDRLKLIYRQFVDRLREMSHDTVENTRKHAVVTMATLLTSHAEQERTLLENLVNKIGDERRAVCCCTVRKLSKLLRHHPAMRTVVVKEVERLLFRPNVGKRVQFYGVCFLGQVQLSDTGDQALAERIIRIYIGFFKASVKLAELDDRLLRALLAGLTSCTGRYQLASAQLVEYTTPLYHIAQLSHSMAVVTQALQLIFRLTSSPHLSDQPPPDRFYTLLYKKMLVTGLSESTKLSDFLNLLFCAITADPCERRMRAFIKRLLQWGFHQNCELLCAVLIMVSEIFRLQPHLHCVDAPVSSSTSAAGGAGAAAASGGSGGTDTGRSVWNDADQDDDGDEHFCDVHSSDEETPAPSVDQRNSATVTGWTFRHTAGSAAVAAAAGGGGAGGSAQFKLSVYSASHRDPRWCRAELQPLHELLLLQHHYHPSVALYARRLLQPPAAPTAADIKAAVITAAAQQKQTATADETGLVSYSGNPLVDFKLMRFLNRFCYRNPKRLPSSGSGGGQDQCDAGQSARGMAVTSPAYGQLTESAVPIDERFFHRYFSRRWQQQRDSGAISGRSVQLTDSANNVTDEAFDEFLEQMFDGSGGNKRKRSRRQISPDDDALDTDFASEITRPAAKSKKDGGKADDDIEDDGGDDDEGFSRGGFDDDDDDDFGYDDEEDDDGVGFSHGKHKKIAPGGLVSADQFPVDSEDDDVEVPMTAADAGDDEEEEDGGGALPASGSSKGKLRQLQWEAGRQGNRDRRKRSALSRNRKQTKRFKRS